MFFLLRVRAIIAVLVFVLIGAVTLSGAPNASDLYQQGMQRYQAKDYKGAEFYFSQVCQADPQNNQARFYAAVSMAMQGKPGLAKQQIFTVPY